MQQISLREFQLHPTKYIKNLPIVITQYNKPVATIVPHMDVDQMRSIAKTDMVKKVLAEPLPEKIEDSKSSSKWPSSYLGKPLSGKSANCPICHELVPTEFAQKHYMDDHGDI